MKYFVDKDNKIYAYAPDGSQDHLIGNKTPVSPDQVEKLKKLNNDRAFAALSYAEKRQLSYPPIGDQLDAMWKGGAALDEMRQRIQAVKDQYPKVGK